MKLPRRQAWLGERICMWRAPSRTRLKRLTPMSERRRKLLRRLYWSTRYISNWTGTWKIWSTGSSRW